MNKEETIGTYLERAKNNKVVNINQEYDMYQSELDGANKKIVELTELTLMDGFYPGFEKKERDYHKKMLAIMTEYRETVKKLLAWKSGQISREIKIQRG